MTKKTQCVNQMTLSVEELLELKSVTRKIAEEIAQNYRSLISIALSSPHDLASQLNISFNRAERIIDEVREKVGLIPTTADELLEIETKRPTITTMSTNLDGILNGGIPLGMITEFSGSFGSGKTQLCLQLCLTVQLDKSEGGVEGSAYFIDSENTFSAARLAEMANAPDYPLEPKKVLKNIHVAKAFNADHQASLVQQVESLIEEENIRILIVDSIASHFRSEFIGKETLVRRQQLIMQHAQQLQKIAEIGQVAVVVTNQVLANPDAVLSGNIEPALGFAWGHRPAHRIFLRKTRSTARIARIFDSPYLPEREAVFHITPYGIRDQPIGF